MAERMERVSVRLLTATSSGTLRGKVGDCLLGRMSKRTGYPASLKCLTSALPMKPVPPVTKIMA
jgi:hypothetical protein